MGRYIHDRLRLHPVLIPLRDAREAYAVHCHDRAVYATAVREIDGGGWQIRETIEAARWWMPLRRSRGENLADELATRLRARWDERSRADPVSAE
jgi:hypothetical protein